MLFGKSRAKIKIRIFFYLGLPSRYVISLGRHEVIQKLHVFFEEDQGFLTFSNAERVHFDILFSK